MSLRRSCITTGLLCATGDILSQSIDERPYDPRSTIRNGLYGLAIFGPIGHRLYPALNRVQPFQRPSANILVRLAIDQLASSPIGLALYLSSMSVMEGRVGALPEKLHNVYVNVLITNWTVWPLFQAVNFTLIPVQNRLLAVNIASIGWNSYLSWKNRHSMDQPHEHI